MSVTGWGHRTVTLHVGHVVLALVCALTVGVLVGLNLPFGAKPMTMTNGTAHISIDGDGSFQPDHGGVTAYIPNRLAAAGVPACLQPKKDETVSARVEAGYAELRGPGDSGTYVVGWIRCL